MDKYILGLDIGVASVGWGIIDSTTGKILEAGSRIFNSANASANVERRVNRQSRRLTRRKRHRRERIDRLLRNYNIIPCLDNSTINPYELRVKGLKEKLEIEELYSALFHLAKRRGISYLDDVEDENAKNVDSGIKINQDLLKKHFPCEIQMERLNEYGKVRGIIEASDNQLLNIFPTSEYKKEAKKLIEVQRNYYPSLDSEFENEYIKILTDKRDYFVGPGNEKSRTDYGIYRTNKETLENLFEILIGKCSIYPDEYRAAGASYTAQEFNLLNDLNNLTISNLEDGKLTIQQKIEVINMIKDANSVNIVNIIRKVTGCKKEEISGVPTTKDGKTNFQHTFSVYRKFKKEFEEKNLNFSIFTNDIFDRIGYILTLNSEISKIKQQLKSDLKFDEDVIEICTSIKKKNKSSFSKWQNFSLKAMKEMIPELYATNKNQMNILSERGLLTKNNVEKYKNYKYIPEKEIVEDIYNPIAARSIRQSIKIVNAIIKKYGELESIVIEMPRDYVSEEDQKKELTKIQKSNEDEKNNALKRAKSEYGFSDEEFNRNKNLMTKIRLWYQQNGKCLYSGKNISMQDLVKNPNNFDIDHIIPQSISFDDGLNNKVICYAEENRKKGQRTPFYYMQSRTSDWTFEKMKSYISNDLNGMSKTKKEMLLTEENFNKWEVRQKFIARNLVDTRYASRVVLNSIEDFMKAHNKDTKVKVIRGKFTSQLRRRWGIDKNREENYTHHAKDALIVAASNKLKLWENSNFYEIDKDGYVSDRKTGEFIELLSEKDYETQTYQEPFKNFIYELKNIDNKVKISHMVSKKTNRKISDATIYSTRKIDDNDMVVGKIKNIYNNKSYESFKKVYEKDKTRFLMFRNDKKTFENLERILKEYPDVPNPFAKYKEEHGIFRKYSKKDNGPEIYDLKYFDGKLGQHIDITIKSNNKSNNKKIVLKQVIPFRADVYFDYLENKYRIIGVKNSMFKFDNGNYKINQNKYKKLLERENIGKEFKFYFSFYQGDIIEIENDKGCNRYRFWSKNETSTDYVELKPIEMPKYLHVKQNLMSATKNTVSLNKYYTDILGNVYLAPFENDPRIKDVK